MKHIFLLGPKHCGKTTIGEIAAFLCSCAFIDLDEELTRMTGKTPRNLYIEGKEIFQKAEIESLCRCAAVREKFIMAIGGGIIDNTEAVSILKNFDAIKVYLGISAETAWQRISGEGELPPFLQTDNPKETHRKLHERRAALYLQLADIIINADGKTPQAIAAEIIKEIPGAIG